MRENKDMPLQLDYAIMAKFGVNYILNPFSKKKKGWRKFFFVFEILSPEAITPVNVLSELSSLIFTGREFHSRILSATSFI